LADQGDGNHFAFLGTLETAAEWLDHLSAAGHGETFARLEPDQRYHVLITHHGSRGLWPFAREGPSARTRTGYAFDSWTKVAPRFLSERLWF